MSKKKRGAKFKKKRLDSLLIKPAGPDCNMDCGYCFYSRKAAIFDGDRHRMDLKKARYMVFQAMRSSEGRRIHFAWQGGEPTLMGIGFFREVMETMEAFPPADYGNLLQTNGLLLDDEWARFLTAKDFLVGLSIDGAEHVHDRYRVDKAGRGTWSRARDAALLLKDHGVEFNALAVVNDYSVHYLDETYNSFKDMGIDFMQFIPCVEPDPEDPARPACFSVGPEDYGAFLCNLFDLWLADFEAEGPIIFVSNMNDLLHILRGLGPTDCLNKRECGDYLVIEHDGGAYPCDFFVEPELRLGNAFEDELENLLNSKTQKDFGRRKARIKSECGDCRWLRMCRGGCPNDRIFTDKPNYFCESYKALFEHMEGNLTRLRDALQWRRAELDNNFLTDL